jgi:hypothetical protein
MLTKNLDITYSMVWSIALANVLGTGLCFTFSGQLAKLATLRYTLIMPCVLSLIYIGGFEATRQWGDLYSLLFFGLLGWAMKHFRWPRPPLVLGFILGSIIERYMFISIERFGAAWLTRPFVIVMFAMAFLTIVRPLLQDVRDHKGIGGMLKTFGAPRFTPGNLFPAALLSLIAVMFIISLQWDFSAKIIPVIVGIGALTTGGLSLANDIFSTRGRNGANGKTELEAIASSKIHMDVASKTEHLPPDIILIRGAMFFGWLVAFLCSMAVIGLLPTVPIFVVAYMRLEGPEKWRHSLIMAAAMTLLIYVVFDQLLAIPWPPTVLGGWMPWLKDYVPTI